MFLLLMFAQFTHRACEWTDKTCMSYSRHGLELHPTSYKHDGEARRKCYSYLQATIQQTNSSGDLVQKQPAFHSSTSCNCTSQWRSLFPKVCVSFKGKYNCQKKKFKLFYIKA